MKKSFRSTWIIPFVILSLVYIQGCEKKSPTRYSEQETIISDKAVVFESEPGVSLDIVKDSTYIFSFSGQIREISQDNILVGSEKGGYLRRVLSAHQESSLITIETGHAYLTDAVIKGQIDTTIKMNIEGSPPKIGEGLVLVYAAKGVDIADGIINLSGVELFSGSVGGANVQVSIDKGSISFDPSLDFGFQIDHGIKEFHAIARGQLVFDCDLQVKGSNGFSYSKEINIITLKHTSYYMVGVLPVVLVTTIHFDAGFEAAVSAAGITKFGVDGDIDINVGAKYYAGSWSSVWDNDVGFTGQLMEWQKKEANIRGYIRPGISVELYSVAGPYIEVEPYLRFAGEITPFPSWSWNLYGGIGGYLGFQASILSYNLVDYSTELFKYEKNIAGDCNHSPNTPSNPSPFNGASNQSIDVNLSWTGGDPDGDPVTYDVYFGTSSSPPLVASGRTSTSYDPGTLNYNTKYYWKIVSKDNRGGQTTGSVWNFTTGAIDTCDITVISPASYSNWTKGTQQTITWNSSNAGSYVMIHLYKDGSNQRTITNSTPNDGSYTWAVDDFGQGTGSGYLIKISDAGNTSCWGNSPNFTITVPTCNITVTEPSSEDVLEKGTRYSVYWTSSNGGSYVKFDLYKGSSWVGEIAPSIINDGVGSWTCNDFGQGAGTNYRIKITDLSDTSCYDYSDYFTITITESCDISVTSPEEGDQWCIGESKTISWSYIGGCGSNVIIRLYKGTSFVGYIANSTLNDGSYTWNVTDFGQGAGSDYRVNILDPTSGDRQSTGNFTIDDCK